MHFINLKKGLDKLEQIMYISLRLFFGEVPKLAEGAPLERE